MRQVIVCGLRRVDQMFVLTMAVYNLTRMGMLEEIRLEREKKARTWEIRAENEENHAK